MNPTLTLNPVLLARDLAGTQGADRAMRLRIWITAFTSAIVLSHNDTTMVLNGSASVMWLQRQLALVWEGP